MGTKQRYHTIDVKGEKIKMDRTLGGPVVETDLNAKPVRSHRTTEADLSTRSVTIDTTTGKPATSAESSKP